MSISGQIPAILFLTVLNAFFAGAEIAILSVRRSRLRELAEGGHRAARVALRLREDPERFLATIQIGTTVCGIGSGVLGGAALEPPLASALRLVGAGPAAERLALVVVAGLISATSIVLGELVPKSLALRSAERAALWVSRPLFIVSRIATPAIWLLTLASNVVLRPFRDRTTFVEGRLSRAELQQLLDEATAAGTVDRESGEIASRAIELGGLRVYSVMIPRNEVAFLSLAASRADVERMLRERPHARYPVLDERGQKPVGYLLAHEVYEQLLRGKLDLAGALRAVPIVPELGLAVSALRALQEARTEIGVVVEEHGAVVGIVSVEALSEELFGAILSEHEEERTGIVRIAEGSFLVRGDTPLHRVNRELGTELPIDATASTMAGLVLRSHGSFPAVGACLSLPGGAAAEVLEVEAQRVRSVRLTLRGPDSDPARAERSA